MEKEDSNFSGRSVGEDEIGETKADKERRDLLHNILQGPLSSERRRAGAFFDAWLC